MNREEMVLKLKPLLAAFLEKGGFVLADLRFYKNQNRDLVFEILVDWREGGITLDECARLNRELGDIIENSEFVFGGSYLLEVSSPGLDRPLVTSPDFSRVLGREVRVFLREPVDDRIEYQGRLESADEGKIVVITEKKNIEIPLDKINKAKQVIA